MSIRQEKVSSQIKRTMAGIISEMALEVGAGIATLTSVKVTPDLQIAKAYISVYGGKLSPGEFLEELDRRKGELRSYLGSKIRLRYTPELNFYIDDTLDQMEHIQDLLDNINNKKSND